MQIYGWIWLLLGIALIALEVILPTFTLLWYGLGATLIGLLGGLLALPASVEVALWIGASSLALLIAWAVIGYRRRQRQQR